MIEVPENVKIGEIPIEKRYKSVTAGLVRRIKILYDAIYEKYGGDGLDLIREEFHDCPLILVPTGPAALSYAPETFIL